MLLPALKETAEKLLIPKSKISKSKKPELIELILKQQEIQDSSPIDTINLENNESSTMTVINETTEEIKLSEEKVEADKKERTRIKR